MERTARHFMKVGELADALGCSRSKAYEIVKSGAIKSVTIAGLLRVPVEALDSLALNATGSESDAQ
jgi:excisionase family DNA binding protein